MNCSVVSVFTNLHCAECVCLYSTHLAVFLLREMLGIRYGPEGPDFSDSRYLIFNSRDPNRVAKTP